MGKARVRVPDTTEVEAEPGDDRVLEVPDAGDLELLVTADTTWKWAVYRLLTPDERMRAASSKETRCLLTYLSGPVDLASFNREHGGGTFEFWGSIEGQRGLQDKVTVTLAGPIKPLHPPIVVPPTVTPSAPPATVSNGGVSPELVALLAGQQRMLEDISKRLAVPAPAPGLTLKDLLELAPLLNGGQQQGESLKEMIRMFQQGLELGSQRDPSEKTMGELVLEKALPSLERVATAIATRRPVPTPRPREAEATVVGTAPVTPVAEAPSTAAPASMPEVSEDEARWIVVIGSLSRAIQTNQDPTALVDAIDPLLTDDELVLLRMSNADDLLREMSKRTGTRYPVLSQDTAKPYLERVLVELRRDDSEPA